MSAEPGIMEAGERTRLLVRTVSGSRYEIDLAEMWLRRIPDRFRVPEEGQPISADLRRDGEAIQIRAILSLEVGSGAEFILEPLGHPERVAFTQRSTTPVTSIEIVTSSGSAEDD